MQRLEVSGAVRPIYGSLGVKRLISKINILRCTVSKISKKRIIPSFVKIESLVQKLQQAQYADWHMGTVKFFSFVRWRVKTH